MKKLAVITTFLAFLSLSVKSQNKSEYKDYNLPVKDGEVFYEYIDSTSAKGKTLDQIYYAAQRVFVESFNDAKKAIDISDKQDGHITAKGEFPVAYSMGIMNTTDYVKCIIDFKAKDGKYRIQIYDFTSTFYNEKTYHGLERVLNFWNKNWRARFFKSFDSQNQKLLASFKEKISTITKSNPSDF